MTFFFFKEKPGQFPMEYCLFWAWLTAFLLCCRLVLLPQMFPINIFRFKCLHTGPTHYVGIMHTWHYVCPVALKYRAQFMVIPFFSNAEIYQFIHYMSVSFFFLLIYTYNFSVYGIDLLFHEGLKSDDFIIPFVFTNWASFVKNSSQPFDHIGIP